MKKFTQGGVYIAASFILIFSLFFLVQCKREIIHKENPVSTSEIPPDLLSKILANGKRSIIPIRKSAEAFILDANGQKFDPAIHA